MDRVGFFRRIVAYLLDVVLSLILGIALYVLAMYALQPMPALQKIEMFHGRSLPLWQIVGAVLAILAPAVVGLSEALFARSPGKVILGLIIMDENESSASAAQLMARWLLKYHLPLFQLIAFVIPGEFESMPLGVVSFILGIGTIGVFFPNRQTLYDRITGSAVYSLRQSRVNAQTAQYYEQRGQCAAADQLLFK